VSALVRQIAALALLACGCAQTIPVVTPPPELASAVHEARLPVAVDYVGAKFGGRDTNVSDALVLSVLTSLRKASLFSEVYEPGVAHEAPADALHLSLRLEQTEKLENPVTGMLKALLLVGSAFLLTPVLPYQYEYDLHLAATLDREDGWTRDYESRAHGSVSYYPVLLADAYRAGVDTRDAVLARALERLTNELAEDEALAKIGRPPD
jgi:hypothetical protein